MIEKFELDNYFLEVIEESENKQGILLYFEQHSNFLKQRSLMFELYSTANELWTVLIKSQKNEVIWYADLSDEYFPE